MTESTDPMDHQKLAWKYARPHFGKGVDEEDLMQEANVGLIRARDGFDESRGLKFSTYAVPKIRGAIQNYFRDKARLVQVPANVAVMQRRGLTSDSPGLNPSQRDRLRAAERVDRALSFGDGEAKTGSMATRLAAAPVDEPKEDGRLDAVMAAIQRLPSREADVIRKRYGLDGGEPMVLAEIAAEYGLTHQMLSKIHASAIKAIQSVVLKGDDKP